MTSHAVKENQDMDADSEEDEWSKCPVCQKKLKNVLLHLKKSSVCHAGVCEEDYKKIVEQSKVKRKKKKKLWKNERRMKDNDKFKSDQKKWTQKSRDLARENDLEEKVEKLPIYEVELRSLDSEDGLCPCCNKKCKNLLLHLNKSSICKMMVSEGDIQKLSEERRRIRQNRANDKAKKMRASMPGREDGRKNKYDAEWGIKCPGCDEDKRNILLHLNYSKECRATVSEEEYQKMVELTQEKRGKIQLETLQDRQNRRKAKSRKKAREEDYEKVKKYQRESTAKWRAHEKKRDPEKDAEISIRVSADQWWNSRKMNGMWKINSKLNEEEYQKMVEETLEKKDIHNIHTETVNAMQNRWKAKSRDKAREKDYESVKKYQRESTAKWKAKEKQKDPELFLARTQLWNRTRRRVAVPWYALKQCDFRNCPKTLKRNIHRLIDTSEVKKVYCSHVTCRLKCRSVELCALRHFPDPDEKDKEREEKMKIDHDEVCNSIYKTENGSLIKKMNIFPWGYIAITEEEAEEIRSLHTSDLLECQSKFEFSKCFGMEFDEKVKANNPERIIVEGEYANEYARYAKKEEWKKYLENLAS